MSVVLNCKQYDWVSFLVQDASVVHQDVEKLNMCNLDVKICTQTLPVIR